MSNPFVRAARFAGGLWIELLCYAISPVSILSFLLIAIVSLVAASAVDWYNSDDEQCVTLPVALLRVDR